MKKKNLKNAPTMAKRSAMIMAAVTFFFGFFAGAAFEFFKTDSAPGIASNSGTAIDFAQKVNALEAEVINHPQNTNAWIQLGHVYFDTKIYDKAIHAYEKALKLNPNNANVLTDLGIMYRRSGQFRKAVEKFDKAVAVDPMSFRLASSMTRSPFCEAYRITSARTSIPAGPSCSKNAACGLTAGTNGATVSITPRQNSP